jgi:N utilization substance protein A
VTKINISSIQNIIDEFIEEKGITKETVIQALTESLETIYSQKFPEDIIKLESDEESIKIQKQVTIIANKDRQKENEILLKEALKITKQAKIGDIISLDITNTLTRLDMLKIKQLIQSKIKLIEVQAISKEFENKKNTIVNGTVHKTDRFGSVFLIFGYNAYLPKRNTIGDETFAVGQNVRVLISDINKEAKSFEEVIVLDRASESFMQKLLELEIPELFEGIITIKKIARIAGYKTKLIVETKNTLIDPVGSCIGREGARIKSIFKEINFEKIDFIKDTDDAETLIKGALKPAKINFVEIKGKCAYVFLDSDQKGIATGRYKKNIELAREISSYDIELFDSIEAFKEALSLQSTEKQSDLTF